MTASSSTPVDFDVLAREHSPELRRYLARQVGDATLADDLLQETLIRVARGLHGFAGRAAPRTWMFAIANHVVADHLRSPARRQRIVDIDEAAHLDDGVPTIEERLEFDEMNRCVREVIDSLPADYRSALILHDLEGMSAEQVSEVMGGTVGAAKVRIHRARLRLKAALERSCGFYHDSDSNFRCAPR